MNILIIGIPYFAQNLCTMLQTHDKSNTYAFLNTYKNRRGISLLIPFIIKSDIVISIGGTIWYKNEVDLTLLFKKKLLFFWVGTDVLTAEAVYKKNAGKSKYIQRAFHFCECEWIQNELKAIGINATILPFAAFENIPNKLTPFPSSFSMLTYVRPERPEFYGIKEIIKLALRFPAIKIKIAGINSIAYEIPQNIELVGWIQDFSCEIKKSTVFIRMPEHDGLSFSVLESLLEGRYVFYKYDFPHTIYTPTFSDLEKKVDSLFQALSSKNLNINSEGHNFIKKNYNMTLIVNNLVNTLKSIKPKDR